jgi:hypothetical protein
MRTHGIIILFSIKMVINLMILNQAFASVSGDCENCHVLFPGVPREDLPYTLCILCHSNSSADTIKMLGNSQVPIVNNTVQPEHPLAGGNFYYITKESGERKGHNVDGIAFPDSKFNSYPPGYKREYDPSLIGYNRAKTLKCSGSNGCHGNRNIEDPFRAILGTHHAPDNPIDGSTTAKSYRYLKITDKVKGVTGFEDEEWNRNYSTKKHNEYTLSIDMLCASCHSSFHFISMESKKNPWFRHPTGILLPDYGEYAYYNPENPPPTESSNVRIYNADVPVGRIKLTQIPSDEVKPGEDVILCLSCHVAHSSPYDSILRWDYDAIFTGEEGKGGCLICHTGK